MLIRVTVHNCACVGIQTVTVCTITCKNVTVFRVCCDDILINCDTFEQLELWISKSDLQPRSCGLVPSTPLGELGCSHQTRVLILISPARIMFRTNVRK